MLKRRLPLLVVGNFTNSHTYDTIGSNTILVAVAHSAMGESYSGLENQYLLKWVTTIKSAQESHQHRFETSALLQNSYAVRNLCELIWQGFEGNSSY